MPTTPDVLVPPSDLATLLKSATTRLSNALDGAVLAFSREGDEAPLR